MDWNLIGHGWAVDLLRRQLARRTLHHAYLIVGPAGVGREALAVALAQAVLCEQPDESGNWCGSCRACRQVPQRAYPDLHLVEREEGKQGISIEQVRELQRQLALTPHGGRARVALLLDFDRASEAAANALLKTLEEPSGQAVLVLTALEAEAVPPTVRSRCEVLQLREVPLEELTAGLLAVGAAPETARMAAEASDGRPGLARRLLADPGRLDRREVHRQSLGEVIESDLAGRFGLVETWKDPEEVEEKLGVWLVDLRGELVAALQGNRRRLPGAAAALDGLQPKALRRAVGAVLAALQALGQNANPRLTLEVLMLKLPRR